MLGSKLIRFFMSVLNWQINSSLNFRSFFIVMTCNSPVNFKLIHIVLWIKGSHQSPNFNAFECSGENLPNFSCHFWKHKSIFFQISHQYSVPSNLTPFSPSIIYFGQKQPINVQILGIFECSGQNSLNSSCPFWNDKSIPLQIFHHSAVPLLITPL